MSELVKVVLQKNFARKLKNTFSKKQDLDFLEVKSEIWISLMILEPLMSVFLVIFESD